ncbi:DNA methyltransferase [Chromatium weissei]|nr:DNA methyltransferase [Chromatium weissei]
MLSLAAFIHDIAAIYATGNATEHTYRPALTELFKQLTPNLTVINEPKRIACGAPDFMLQSGERVIGYIEAKDVTIELSNFNQQNREQQERYRRALPNLIYTNGLEWQFFREGDLIASVRIGKLHDGIHADSKQFATLENLLRDFIQQHPMSITTPQVLAERMAGKAVLIKDILRNTLYADKNPCTELTEQLHAFQENLISGMTRDEFADVYAETLAYGLFAARLHTTDPQQFNRQNALNLLPKSNPFLRALFAYIAGMDLDERIAWIIDDLVLVFRVTDIAQVLAGFGKLTGQTDPFLHFYETFLTAYNPAKRKARGVWYTPEAVVDFIVRAMDDILKTEFNLSDGLADTSKVTIDWNNDAQNKEVHRVQILDPAVGTGTFLAAVIKQIAPRIKNVAPDWWSRYLETDLIPRLHGFELLMASYAMCHLKLDMSLTELGYTPTGASPRLSVYLTNALEEGSLSTQNLPFAQWLSNEAKSANAVKRNLPIMCILGNPPYSGESANKGEWITNLMEVYKKEPEGIKKLAERNPKWINDDYVKFIRLAEHMIHKNGEGVLGFITNHGYLDNPTFRGMRWHLLTTFNKIYVLDLHGNAKKKEVTPNGQPDKNVFDIQQGVAIIIAVKKKMDAAIKPLADVFHADLWGSRAEKYAALRDKELNGNAWQLLTHTAPQYPFVRRDNEQSAAYRAGFSIQELMPVNSVGIVTARDALTIDIDKMTLWERIQDFAALTPEQARIKYNLGKDVRDWKVQWAQEDVKAHYGIEYIVPIAYRPFDIRWIYYTGKSRGLICYPRNTVMQHLLDKNNISMMISAQQKTPNGFHHVFAHSIISESSLTSNKTSEIGSAFPLYLYSDDQLNKQTCHDVPAKKNVGLIYSRQTISGESPPINLMLTDAIFDARGVFTNKGIAQAAPLYLHSENQLLAQTRRINFNSELYQTLQQQATHTERGIPNELNVFDYIYGMLHCPAYRKIYAEFLRIDFPRIPWPNNPIEFWTIADQGAQLRRLHLMEPAAIGETPYPFSGAGQAIIDKPRFEAEKIWINNTQCFNHVPEIAWTFYIGGYQPAQKWLKDRKGRELNFADIKHYQAILKVLSETYRIMRTIQLKRSE